MSDLEEIQVLALADLIDDADYVKCVRIVPDMDSTSEAEDIISGEECAAIIRALRLSVDKATIVEIIKSHVYTAYASNFAQYPSIFGIEEAADAILSGIRS